MRTPVSIGSVSSRLAAAVTCATAVAKTSPRTFRGVVLDVQQRQVEPDRTTTHRQPVSLDHHPYILGRQCAGDLGEQPAGHQHPTGGLVGDRHLDAVEHFEVETRDDHRAVGHLEDHARGHRDDRTGW
jgi:hypothetical protein